MTPEIRDLLARHFCYARGALKKRGPLTADEEAACADAGYPVDELTELTHDQAVACLSRAAAALTPDEVTQAFVAGVGGSWVRGRQPIISYAHGRHLTPHAADPTPGYAHCRTCGFAVEADVDFTEGALRSHLGHVWNEGHAGYVADLEDFVRHARRAPTESDYAVLRQVLVTAQEAPADCTPGQLEKRIAAAALIPSSDKYQRYGILAALAIVGVLPNALIAPAWDRLVTRSEQWDASKRMRGSARSDIVLPFGGWRGALGVDWARAEALFGVTRG